MTTTKSNADLLSERYDEVWILDTEFQAPSGEPHIPVCMCAVEWFTGRTERIFFDRPVECPMRTDIRVLYVGWALSAEWATWIPLGWQLPAQALDLRFEYLNRINGVYRGGMSMRKLGTGLVHALRLYGLPAMAFDDKQTERDYIIQNGITPPEGVSVEEHQRRILDYCDLDVVGTGALFAHLLPTLDLDQAIHRGMYSMAVGWFEHRGLPLDTEMLAKVSHCTADLQLRIVEQVEAEHGYGVFYFKTKRKTGVRTQHWSDKKFVELIGRLGITNWPRTKRGRYSLDKDDFKDMCQAYPYLEQLRQTRKAVKDLAKFTLAVGRDGRNRFAVMPFGGLSGRNQSKARQFLMLKSKWVRHLLKPGPGRVLIQLDIVAAEAGLAAALSGDPKAIELYNSGADQYLEFAKFVDAVPVWATKESHAVIRAQYKTAFLGINYGMGYRNLAVRLKMHEYEAEKIIADHKRMFAVYWAWADAQITRAKRDGYIETMYGWGYEIPRGKSPNTVLNFPQQATCAELLRLVCMLMVEIGLGPYMCAPLHDAVYLECPEEIAERVANQAEECFRVAGQAIVGDAVTIRTDRKIVYYPNRYEDEDGQHIWKIVQKHIADREAAGYSFPTVPDFEALAPGKVGDEDEFDDEVEAQAA